MSTILLSIPDHGITEDKPIKLNDFSFSAYRSSDKNSSRVDGEVVPSGIKASFLRTAQDDTMNKMRELFLLEGDHPIQKVKLTIIAPDNETKIKTLEFHKLRLDVLDPSSSEKVELTFSLKDGVIDGIPIYA